MAGDTKEHFIFEDVERKTAPKHSDTVSDPIFRKILFLTIEIQFVPKPQKRVRETT